MLTRIEIDGFKSFENIAIDVPPFMVILGANGVGKSNLFDALQLLSHMATSVDLRSAFAEIRGEAQELFRRQPDGTPVERLRIKVEVLLPLHVEDAYKDKVEVPHTRVAYEVVIAMRKEPHGSSRLIVESETAEPIYSSADRWMPFGKKPSKNFKKTYCRYSRSTPYISLDSDDAGNKKKFFIHQDGVKGRKREIPAGDAEATVLSSVTTAAQFPTLYALKEELRSWRFLQLDPMSLRKPSQATDAETLAPDGRNLARVLARLRSETATAQRVDGVLSDISSDLIQFVSGITRISVENDQSRREYRIDVTFGNGGSNDPFNARVLSDGTLRLLALFTLLHDPRLRGMVCFEEPENGIHPQRLGNLMSRLRTLVCDPHSELADPDQPLIQVLLNSHSPVVLSSLCNASRSGEVWWADLVSIVGSDQLHRRCTRLRPVQFHADERMDAVADSARTVTDGEVRAYLNTVNGGH